MKKTFTICIIAICLYGCQNNESENSNWLTYETKDVHCGQIHFYLKIDERTESYTLNMLMWEAMDGMGYAIIQFEGEYWSTEGKNTIYLNPWICRSNIRTYGGQSKIFVLGFKPKFEYNIEDKSLSFNGKKLVDPKNTSPDKMEKIIDEHNSWHGEPVEF